MYGIPVELIDAAGLREAGDEAERMGIAKSHEAIADADVVLLVVDAAAGGMSGEDCAVLERCESGGSAMLVAWNKWDLVGEKEEADSFAALRNDKDGGEADSFAALHSCEQRPLAGDPGLRNDKGKALRTSALTGEGIPELRAAIVAAVAGADAGGLRSEERRGGDECRARWSPYW